jgi:phenylacetate-CoA ligase
VSYAYEFVPFYRRRYESEDIHPTDIKDIDDYRALPFLTRDDVKENQEALISTEYRGKVFEGTTGGSTGQPMKFLTDRATGLWSYAVEARCRGWYGVSPGDKMAWVYGMLKDFPDWPMHKRLAAYLKRHRHLNPRTMNEETMRTFADLLVRWRPTMFRGYPSALSMFAGYLNENGIRGISPKLIETTAEKVTPAQRELLEDVFGAQVADHYSSWEIYDMAYQCPKGGLHVMEDRYLEMVANGRVVEAGRMGEVAVTSLTQYAMPFIRYMNGDVGIYEEGNCPCGRGMPLLREIVGRNSDLLLKPDGSIVHWSSFFTVMRYRPEVTQYQMYQPDREHLEVRLVCKGGIDKDVLDDIRKELQLCFGDSMQISIELVDRIEPTPAGKHRFIISEVKPDYL